MKRRPGDSTGDSQESVVFGALQLARIAAGREWYRRAG